MPVAGQSPPLPRTYSIFLLELIPVREQGSRGIMVGLKYGSHGNRMAEGAKMDNGEVNRYKDLLLSKRQELSTGKSLAESIPTAGELRGDPVDMAASETYAATQVRLHQTDGKLLRAIEDALTRIRNEKFGVCEECGEPISNARLQAVPWTRWCLECKARQDQKS